MSKTMTWLKYIKTVVCFVWCQEDENPWERVLSVRSPAWADKKIGLIKNNI